MNSEGDSAYEMSMYVNYRRSDLRSDPVFNSTLDLIIVTSDPRKSKHSRTKACGNLGNAVSSFYGHLNAIWPEQVTFSLLQPQG